MINGVRMIEVEVMDIEGTPQKEELKSGERTSLHEEDWEKLNEDERGKYLLTDDGKSFVKYYLRRVV